jgi:hypothetical protein
MLRAVGTFGLGILFVAVSPALRVSLISDVDALQNSIIKNSPWSYVAIAAGVLAILMFGLYRASQPRS